MQPEFYKSKRTFLLPEDSSAATLKVAIATFLESRDMSRIPSLRKKTVTTSKSRKDYAVVRISGKDHYLGKFGSKESKQRYKRLISQYLASGRTKHNKVERATVSEICIDYVVEMTEKFTKSDGSVSSELANVKRVIREFRSQYGDVVAEEFGPLDFKAFRKQFIEKGLKRNTCNRYMAKIQECFKAALQNQKISATCWYSLKAIDKLKSGESKAPESSRTQPVPRDHIDRTLVHLPQVVADMVRIQLLTGMRPSEVCRLKPDSIDRTDKSCWIYTPQKHKTAHHGHSRIIGIGKNAQQILTPYLFREQNQFCFQPKECVNQVRRERSLRRKTPEKYGNSVGTNRSKNPKRKPTDFYKTATYEKAIARAAKKAEVPHWTPQQIRVASGGEMRDKFGLEVAQSFLGHMQRITTERYYAPSKFETAKAAIKKHG